MRNFKRFILLLIVLFSGLFARSQDLGMEGYVLMGNNQKTIELNQTITKTAELYRFDGAVSTIFGLGIKADIAFENEKSQVRIILVDQLNQEYLVYETYPLLETQSSFSINNLCEETGILDAVKPQSIRIEITDATVSVNSITYSTGMDKGVDFQKLKKDKKNLQNGRKIQQINKSITARGLAWAAGNTRVSELTYAEKKRLFGQSTFPSGIEYYVGGVISDGDGLTLKSATASAIVDKWDWRDRHGKNWITSIKDQGTCGSCWAFAATGATEAQVNLYYNQPLNMDLSEQMLLSCSGAGTCTGGFPSMALDYVKSTGIIDEAAFPYTATEQLCANQLSNQTDQIKISGRVNFGSTAYPATEDNLKMMIIKFGPLSGGLLDWSHAMTLVGWQVVKEGDRFFYRDLNKERYWYTVPAGSSLIGKTVWIFKNSWGQWGDAGYIYVETSVTNFGWTHALVNPIQSLKQNYTVQCVDNDHDGYYWWGLGPKPVNCPLSPASPDGNDADATLGPLDSNGNCILLNGSPVADFGSDKTAVSADGSVNFTDASTNSPSSWSWTFDGGTPATSTSVNPAVTYKSAGTFNVTLTVSNGIGSNTKIKTGYITVNPIVVAPVVNYCNSNGNASKEWISAVSLNGSTFTSVSSGATGYENFTAKAFTANLNGTCTLNLTPKYSGKANASGWSVWIDFNHDSDFNDTGEQVVVASNVKTSVSKNFTIPVSALTGPTRMRVSMKRSAVPLPCEVFAYGEVEDYTINISAALASDPFVKNASIEPTIVNQAGSFKLFPNPVIQMLNFEVDEVYEKDSYSIFTIQGALIFRRLLNSPLMSVDVSSFPAGIYLVKVENGSRSFEGKFVKKK